MRAFDIGFIPTGWTKGEKLEIQRGKSVGMVLPVSRRSADGDVWGMSYDLAADAERVNVWLRWWVSGD